MAGAATFLGTLCKRGHDYNGTGKSLRYVSSGSCCTQCRKETSKRWSENNADHHKNLKKAWQDSNHVRGADWKQKWRSKQGFIFKALSSAKSRAHAESLPFSLTLEFLQELWDRQEGACHWLKVKMDPVASRFRPSKPTLDRLLPALGYVEGNVVWACNFANLGRGNTPIEDFEAFLKTLKEEF